MIPAVSIVTPTYNRAHLLPRVWASISRQTETNFEWIVVDDGSTDDARQVVMGFQDSRIRYFFQKNKGVNHARNRGDAEILADYVIYLDSDDELLSETTLAEMLTEIRAARPEIASVAFTVVDDEGRPCSSCLPASRVETSYVDHVCEQTIQGEFISINRREVAQLVAWPSFRSLEALRHWRIARRWPVLMVNRTARVMYRNSGDNLTGDASTVALAGELADAMAELIVDHEAAWRRHCPCQLGKYRFYRAMYLALSAISIRAIPDLLVAFRYGSWRIRSQSLLLLGSLVFPIQIRKSLFLKWAVMKKLFVDT